MSDHAKWVRQYLAGASLKTIARKFSVGVRTVRAELVLRGVELRRPGPKQVDLVAATEWPALYRSGLTLRQIAAQSDVSAPTVRKYLIVRGMKLRPSYRPPDARGLWHHEAVKLRAEGWSYKAIAKHFGKSRQTVFSVIKRLSA